MSVTTVAPLRAEAYRELVRQALAEDVGGATVSAELRDLAGL